METIVFIAIEIMMSVSALFYNWYFVEVKEFQATPTKELLVPLRGSFQNFRRAFVPFFMWESPHEGGGGRRENTGRGEGVQQCLP